MNTYEITWSAISRDGTVQYTRDNQLKADNFAQVAAQVEGTSPYVTIWFDIKVTNIRLVSDSGK